MDNFIYFNYKGKKTKATLIKFKAKLLGGEVIDKYKTSFIDENGNEVEGVIIHITKRRMKNYGKTIFMVRNNGITTDYEILSTKKDAQQLKNFIDCENRKFLDEWYITKNNKKPPFNF